MDDVRIRREIHSTVFKRLEDWLEVGYLEINGGGRVDGLAGRDSAHQQPNGPTLEKGHLGRGREEEWQAECRMGRHP